MQQRFIRGNRTQPSAKFGRSELLQSSAHRGQHRQCRTRCGRCEAGDCRKAKLFHLSTAAQSELFDTDSENDPPQFKKCRALSSPRCPSARAVNVRTRPQLGLAGVFCISGSHLVRLVPQLESGQNCSECLFRLAQGANEGLSGSLYNGGQDGSVCPIPKR